MATPTVLFREESPLKLVCGEPKDVTVTVGPRALGKCEVKLFLTATTCNFDDVTKELVQEVDCTDVNVTNDCVFAVSITCERKQVNWIMLKCVATNSEGNSFEDKILTKVNCREDATTSPSTTNSIS